MSSSSSSLRSMLLAAVVAFGITTVWFVLAVWLFSLTEQSQVARGDYEQFYVRLDGVPVIVKQTLRGQGRQVLSLDRQPATGDVYQILYPAYVAPAGSGPSLVSSRDWTNRLAAISDGGSPATYWYLVHDGRANGLAYGVGYNSATKQAIGYFSREGFSERLPPREAWFQVKGDTGLAYATPERTYYEPYFYSQPLQPSQFLLANNKLWQIDTRKRSVKPLLDCPDAEAIGWAWRTGDSLPELAANSPQQQAATAPRSLFVRTADAAVIVDPGTGDVQRYPLPANLQAKTLAAFRLADERLLLAASPLVAGQDQLVVWIDPEGNAVEKQFALESPNRSTDETTISVVSAFAAPALVWQILMMAVLVIQKLAIGEANATPAAIGQAIAICWPGIVLVLAISCAGAAAAYRRQRRFGLPGAIGWAILAFVFGLPGWIAYRLHRTWPVLEECPACDQPAPRDREACTECGAFFPQPELKGVEVFA